MTKKQIQATLKSMSESVGVNAARKAGIPLYSTFLNGKRTLVTIPENETDSE